MRAGCRLIYCVVGFVQESMQQKWQARATLSANCNRHDTGLKLHRLEEHSLQLLSRRYAIHAETLADTEKHQAASIGHGLGAAL